MDGSRIVLGSPSLTAGIPGEGFLTIAEIQKWLADPKNHEPLDVALPLGLRSASLSIPSNNPLTRAKIELGRQLFSDPRLAKNQHQSCTTCHQSKKRFTSDPIVHPRLRETAVTFNRVLGREQFWDGRAKSLEDQIHFTVEHPDEMNTTQDECVAQINSVAGYRLQFAAVFGRLDFAAICEAIASFERALVTSPAPWDYHVELKRLESLPETAQVDAVYLAEIREAVQREPLSEAAKRGSELFFSERLGCSRCHSGPNFSDEKFHDIGLRKQGPSTFAVRKEADDLGRFQVTKREEDRYAFKTPSLRNVEITSPYMHDGRFETLEGTLDYFSRGGDDPNHNIQPLHLKKGEVRDLVAFLKSLTSNVPQPPTDRLPP